MGVTGHRPDRFLESAEAPVRNALGHLFSDIVGALRHIHSEAHEVFDPSPPELRLVSALAEGADQLVAECAHEAGLAIEVVLPFSTEAYVDGFKATASKTRFSKLLRHARSCLVLATVHSDASKPFAQTPYELAGSVLLRQSDLVVAIWDGKEGRGPGGTHQIVRAALSCGLPVIWFSGEGDGPVLLANGEAAEVPAGANGFPERGLQTQSGRDLASMISMLVAPPMTARDGHSQNNESKRRGALASLHRYLAEREPTLRFSVPAYPLLLSIFTGALRHLAATQNRLATIQNRWKAYLEPLQQLEGPFPDRIRDVLMPRFAWAAELAEHYGRMHRNGYVINFLLAAVAVLAGSFRYPMIELTSIAFIILNTATGSMLQWHKRWCDYRALSEHLRQLRSAVLTGAGCERLAHDLSRTQGEGADLWTYWYYRATMREIGLPDLVADNTYIDAAKRAILDGEIVSQRKYHQANAREMRRTAVVMDFVSRAAFWSTFLVCLVQIAHLWWQSFSFGMWLTVCSVILPAFGAASFGIKVYGDFDGAAQRSADMDKNLSFIEASAQNVSSFSDLSEFVQTVVGAMNAELRTWSFVYEGKTLTLP